MNNCQHTANVTITLYEQSFIVYTLRNGKVTMEYESNEPELTTKFMATCHSCNAVVTTDYSGAAQWVKDAYNKVFSAYSHAQSQGRS